MSGRRRNLLFSFCFTDIVSCGFQLQCGRHQNVQGSRVTWLQQKTVNTVFFIETNNRFKSLSTPKCASVFKLQKWQISEVKETSHSRQKILAFGNFQMRRPVRQWHKLCYGHAVLSPALTAAVLFTNRRQLQYCFFKLSSFCNQMTFCKSNRSRASILYYAFCLIALLGNCMESNKALDRPHRCPKNSHISNPHSIRRKLQHQSCNFCVLFRGRSRLFGCSSLCGRSNCRPVDAAA